MSRTHLVVSLLVSILLAATAACSGGGVSPEGTTSSLSAATTSAGSTTPSRAAAPPGVPVPQQIPEVPQPRITPPNVATPPTPDCNAEHSGAGWGVGDRVVGNTPPDPGAYGQVHSVGYAEHPCDDWFVVRIQVPESVEVDVTVKYVDKIVRDAEGSTIPVVGGAKLSVVIGMHGEEWAASREPFPAAIHFAQWGAIRDIQFAGTFEGLTSFGIGVVERNAYTVSSEYWDGLRRIIIKIAH